MAADTDARIIPTHMAHFVLRSGRFDEMLAWYRKVFTAETVFATDSLAFLGFDEEHHRIAIVRNDDLQDLTDQISAIDHVAFTYGSLRDLFTVYNRLKADGIMPTYSIDHGPTTSLYYSDPDGNKMELQVENFETKQGAIDFFHSEAFAKNPIGEFFDPDAAAAKWTA